VVTARLDFRYVGEIHHAMPAADSFHVIQVARAKRRRPVSRATRET
jgi:hypothetical protein